MYLSPDLSTRHLWTYLWQISPAYIGIGAVVVPGVTRMLGLQRAANSNGALPSSAYSLPLVLGLISAAVWTGVLLLSPYPLATLFIPAAARQSGFVEHTRRALQLDELSSVAAAFLWLAYLLVDLRLAGLADTTWVQSRSALLPVLCLCVGPGAAFGAGWFMREGRLSSASKKGHAEETVKDSTQSELLM